MGRIVQVDEGREGASMKASSIIGKRVKRVVQERTKDTCGSIVYHVHRIEFDDGSCVVFGVAELPGDYAVTATAFSPLSIAAAKVQP